MLDFHEVSFEFCYVYSPILYPSVFAITPFLLFLYSSMHYFLYSSMLLRLYFLRFYLFACIGTFLTVV